MYLTKAKNLFIPAGSLSRRIAKGSMWLFAFRVLDQIFRTVRIIILARLLSPQDFGLFGISMIAMSLLEAFSQTGFNQALVQKKEDISSYLNTAWVVQIVRGVVLSLILFFIAPSVAMFFKTPEAENIIKVVSFVVFLQGFSNIAIVYLSKELEFHKYFIYQFLGTIFDFIVSLVIAFMLKSVWALIFGFLAGIIVKIIASYIICSFKPKLSFSFNKMKELFHFGKWIFSSNIIGFFITQGESVMVGRLLGAISLGFYQMAYKIASVLGIEIISGAIFPAYSKIQDNIGKLKTAYLKIFQLLTFILIPLAGGIFVLSQDFIILFLGEKWISITLVMRLLVFGSTIWAYAVLSGPLFQAIGKPKIETKLNLLRLAILVLLVYPFIIKWKILGAALAVFLSTSISGIGYILVAKKSLHFSFYEIGKSILIPVLNTIIMVLLIFLLKTIFPIGLLSFFVLIIFGILIYLLLSYFSEKILKYSIFIVLKESFKLLIN